MHPNATLMETPGYIFLDERVGNIYVISDKINNIANSGNKRWLEENMKFSIVEQLGEQGITDFVPKHPESGNRLGYTIGYDSKYNRIFITKNDFEINEGRSILGQDPLTEVSVPVVATIAEADATYTVTPVTYDVPIGSLDVKVTILGKQYDVVSLADNGVNPNGLVLKRGIADSLPVGGTVRIDYITPGTIGEVYFHNGMLVDYQGHAIDRESLGVTDKSFTVSFDASSGMMLSEHSLTPGFYLTTNESFRAISGSTLYKFGNTDNTIEQESFVDIVNPFKGLSRLSSFMVKAERFSQENIQDFSMSFDEAMVYNSSQCSGYVPLNAKYGRSGGQVFNNFRDIAKQPNFLTDRFKLNPDALYTDTEQKILKRFFDNYVIIRLKTMNIAENYVLLYELSAASINV